MSAAATDDRHRVLGLTGGEYDRIVELLGREPGDTELAMLSLMWSEHCAYKHSKKLLRRLPTEGPAVLMGPGENAGVVDVGAGLGLAFKVESHNHPSAVEPFQGAATGVGGILRDVFAVGARPIAVLDSLRFGEVSGSARSRYLLERAVAGIGHYGNSIGVPTIGGEIYFESSYEHNCLVNAMCLGLAPQERLIRAAAAGPGNVLVLLGALTGRDGIGGASVLASAEFGEGDADKRPTVQIGDPFAEKKLLECSLALLDSELLVSLQDLGAAGLTSSASEMASKGRVGLDIDCDRVPLREPGMEPFEIMVSESQERMLCVVAPERVGDVVAVCERWEIRATPIGEVTDSGRMRILAGGEVAADLPVGVLVDDCPLYDLAPEAPAGGPGSIYPAPGASLVAGHGAPAELLLALLASANLASRLPVFEQYDPVVQSRTVRRPDEADAAVLTLPTGEALAVAIDGNGRRVACDPRTGAAEVVYECAANLACVGGEPLGLTNCLNFGNPEKGHVAWQLTEAVEGIATACEALSVPVIGGNVSLYNEAPGGPIYPTPVIGMVGRLPDPARAGRLAFGAEGDVIAIVGAFARPRSAPSWPSSAASRSPRRCRRWTGRRRSPRIAPSARRVRAGELTSAHDIAEGGIATALAECCIAGQIGARVALPDGLDPFGEALGRAFVVSGSPEGVAAIGTGEPGVAPVIGRVGGPALELEGVLGVPVRPLAEARASGLAALM